VVELRDLMGSEGDDLVDAVNAATTCQDRTRTLEMFLAARVRRVTSPDPQTAAAAGLIDRSGGGAKIDRVARAVGLSPRHLQRRFVEAVGVAPKQYARIVRFQKAIGLLDLGASLTRTALLCGYYDQPHFSREFLDIAGVPPSHFGRSTGPLSGHFIHDASDSYKTSTGRIE
jgi:AraC-like DNA-binding protein